MDGFMNLAKQGYAAYESSQSGHQGQDQSQPYGVQGSAALNSNDNNRPSQGGLELDHEVAQHASNFSGGQDSSLFTTALSFLNKQGDDGEELDEQGIQQAHEKAYGQGDASSLGSKSLGAAAAMQALKSFTSGSSDQQTSSSSGGSFQTKLISMAMAEAAKLFDQQGGASGGNKQDVVNGAGQAMMKLLLKNQVSGLMGGGSAGGSSGGMSQLLGMAKQFM
ncbi:hypothetical protein BCR35DRAFT_349463 [Leucosporidium creatinivorum]|uniref:DUF7721 domain-containing protein n=1 Tax=Leucosporidium creatinivorum TaxID=106004 RepID=A0A1Y2G2R5_9BASI|nr:hypothetical protein BCR35DRAFT_349463 [Leucosporidium creatinivorum]